MREATTQSNADYFRLPRPLWRTLKKCLPKNKTKSSRGGRPRASDRAVVNAPCYVLWTGWKWKALHRDWFGVYSNAWWELSSPSQQVSEGQLGTTELLVEPHAEVVQRQSRCQPSPQPTQLVRPLSPEAKGVEQFVT
jgi:Putative transposase of IS4/5 family (DUF4096)